MPVWKNSRWKQMVRAGMTKRQRADVRKAGDWKYQQTGFPEFRIQNTFRYLDVSESFSTEFFLNAVREGKWKMIAPEVGAWQERLVGSFYLGFHQGFRYLRFEDSQDWDMSLDIPVVDVGILSERLSRLFGVDHILLTDDDDVGYRNILRILRLPPIRKNSMLPYLLAGRFGHSEKMLRLLKLVYSGRLQLSLIGLNKRITGSQPDEIGGCQARIGDYCERFVAHQPLRLNVQAMWKELSQKEFV